MLLCGQSVWNYGLWLWSGVTVFVSEEKPSEERNISKAKICSRCLTWEQEDLLGGIKRLDLDIRNGWRVSSGTSGVRAYSGDECRCAVDTLENLCAGLAEVITRPGLWAVNSITGSGPDDGETWPAKNHRSLQVINQDNYEFECSSCLIFLISLSCSHIASVVGFFGYLFVLWLLLLICFLFLLGMCDFTNLWVPSFTLLHAATCSSTGTRQSATEWSKPLFLLCGFPGDCGTMSRISPSVHSTMAPQVPKAELNVLSVLCSWVSTHARQAS